MAKTTRPPRGGKPSIHCRNTQGDEFHLVVIHHGQGLVSVSDAGMQRIFAPVEAIELISQLSQALGAAGRVGSLSGHF